MSIVDAFNLLKSEGLINTEVELIIKESKFKPISAGVFRKRVYYDPKFSNGSIGPLVFSLCHENSHLMRYTIRIVYISLITLVIIFYYLLSLFYPSNSLNFIIIYIIGMFLFWQPFRKILKNEEIASDFFASNVCKNLFKSVKASQIAKESFDLFLKSKKPITNNIINFILDYIDPHPRVSERCKLIEITFDSS